MKMNLRFAVSQSILFGCATVVLLQLGYQLIHGEPMPNGHQWDVVGELKWEAAIIITGMVLGAWCAWDWRKLEATK